MTPGSGAARPSADSDPNTNPGASDNTDGSTSGVSERPPTGDETGSRRLDELLAAVSGPIRRHETARDVRVTGIVSRAADAAPGALFVALPGTSADGHTFLADAARRGAAAALVERDVGGTLDLPLVRVEDARRALAELAAAWHGLPGERLTMVGITGTAGKTSTLSLLETILVAAGRRVGSIGSLGLHMDGRTLDETVYTTPDPVLLHGELGRIARAGGELTVMEVTSHALVQKRVHGLRLGLGIFTNLLPLEHADYHGGFEGYVEAKSRFFDMLDPGAPLVYNADDPVTCRLVEGRELTAIPCGRGAGALVRVETPRVRADGTRLQLEITRPLPLLDGGNLDPVTVELQLRLLGRGNIANAALAATAALVLGAPPETLAGALADFPPPRRRMEVIHEGRFTVLDDTVGHPESVTAVFELAERLAPGRVHVAWAVRGRRGARINRENAESLAVWAARIPPATLVVTRSADATDDLNEVEEEEYAAFTDVLRDRRIPFEEHDQVDSAVRAVLDAAGEGDLVLLLGAQGMDRGRDVARDWLAETGR